MAYIREIPLDELSDKARELYEKNQAQLGHVPNYLKAFAHRPEVLSAWGQLLERSAATWTPRRYELATLAAAGALRSTYCMLAHGAALLRSRILHRGRGRRHRPGLPDGRADAGGGRDDGRSRRR